jgi:hypothetical protein
LIGNDVGGARLGLALVWYAASGGILPMPYRYHRLKLNRLLVLFFLVLVATTAGFAAAVSINGACELGSCASPDILNSGQSTHDPFDFTYSFLNTDSYHVFGSVGTSNSGGVGIGVTLTAVYLGNTNSTTSQADVLTIDFLQDFADSFTSGVFSEGESIYFYGPIASSSSATAQLSFDGKTLPLQSFAPGGPSFVGFTNITLSGLTEPLAGETVEAFSFGQGSNVGATISTTMPEPSSFLFALIGVFGLLALRSILKRTKSLIAC